MTTKVCHITSVHSYNDTRIFIKECQSLVNEDYEVHYVAPDAPNEQMAGVQLHRVIKSKGNRLIRMTKTVYEVYKKAKEINATIYHFHDPELIPVGIMLKKKGKKVIYDIHEDVPRQILSKHWIPKSLRKMISWIFEKYENSSVKKFDGVITATPFINKRFEFLGCKAINVNNYPLLSELYIPDMDWNDKDRAVCYVGGISVIRGIIEMVEAIGRTDVRLLLGGKFISEQLHEQIKIIDGWKQVNNLGYLDRKQVTNIFLKSSAGLVVLHPTENYIDALPIKMFEYMSAGIPVIASHFPLWKKIVEGNQCGICVNPLNPIEIANAIQWVVDNPDKAKEMGSNGRKAVEEKYNWEKESKKLLSFYKELI